MIKGKDDKERSQLIFNTVPDILMISSLWEGVIVDVNEKFVEITGYAKEDVLGLTTTNIKYWFNIEQREKFVKQLADFGFCENFELLVRKKDGTIFNGLVSAKLIDLDDTPHLISITRDVTARKIIEEKVKILSQAVEQSPASIILTDINGTIQYANRKFFEITGYTSEEIIGKNAKILKSGYHESDIYINLWHEILSGREWTGELLNKKKNGELYWESAKISPVFNDSGVMFQFIAIKEDITERKRLEKELQTQARIDVLTEIANRRYFIELVEKELIRNQRKPRDNAYLMLDIDHFKQVNDNFGHIMGDVALQMVAKVCKDTLRGSDIIGRVGGEEFSIFLVEIDYPEALKVAERVRLNVENIILYDTFGKQIFLKISIGITKYHYNEDTLNTLMQRSDKALYQAKSEGRNRVVSIE